MKGKHRKLDRISALPQDTIEKILTLMPLRDALRTSILSRKWRYTWTTIPKLVFNDDILTVLYYGEDFNKYKFVNPIFHVLLLHKGPILEFSLCVTYTYTDKEISNEIDQIILHLSMNNNIKKFILKIWRGDNNYLLPCSLFSFQQLEHLDVSYCTFKPPSVNKGFSMLKSLRFYEVSVTNNMFFKFLTNCPLLEEFIWTKEGMDINLSECEFVELFKCLPSVQVLELSPLFIKHLAVGGMPHKLPISLPHLRTLVLGVCFLELSTIVCVINSSPNLEKIKVGICGRHDPGCRFQKTYVYLPNIRDYSGVKLDHLKELEVTNFHNDLLETEFVKLIMANSPMLKRARIGVSSYIYVGEHVRMLQGLVNTPFPRASPAVRFTVEEVEEADD